MGSAVHVARQPIHEADGFVHGYELLFRPTAGAHGAPGDATDGRAPEPDGDAATSATILAAFSEFGAEELLGGRPGFLNLTRSFLVGDLPLPVQPGAAILEVLETVRPEPAVIQGARRLAEEGYRLALDDFVWRRELEPLLEVAEIVKIDILAQPWQDVLRTAARCRYHDVRLLAEKVENEQVLARCRDEGFELFQGYHLGRPETRSARTLSPSQVVALDLLGRLSDPQITTDRIEEAVRRDPALVYRLLRIANSAAAGVAREVSSIRDALVMVGTARLRAWLVLLSMASESAGGGENVVPALVRARTCEQVAEAMGLPATDVAFTTGLLHGVGEVLGLSPAGLVERMPALAPELTAALSGTQNPLRRVLDAVLSYEQGRAGAGNDLSGALSVPVDIIARAYLLALAWTTETTSLATAA